MVHLMAGAAVWPDTSERAEDLWEVLRATLNLEPRDIEPGGPDSAIFGAAVKGAVPGVLRWLDTEHQCLTDSGDSSILDLAIRISNANGLPARYNRGALCLIREAEQKLARQDGEPFSPSGMQLSICDALAASRDGLSRTELAGHVADGNRHAIREPIAELQEHGWLVAPRARKVKLTGEGRLALMAHNKP